MFGKQRTDVLVVGAGPTGLCAALRLAEAGIATELVDKHWRTGAHSYALALHPRSLELLDALGVLPELLEHGRRVTRIALYENGQRRAEMDFGRLRARHPFVLVLPQTQLEGELENRLLRRKLPVKWNHRVESVREAEGRMSAEISHLDRVAAGYPIARAEWNVVKTTRTDADWIVGADGYHSHLRERLGIRFEQHGGLETYSVYEFETEEDAGDEMRVAFDGALASVYWPMRERRCRFSFQLTHPQQHEPSTARLNEFLRARAPWFPQVRGEIAWTSMVQFDRRLAQRAGEGRVWLAGDALHLTSPVGVQSMNAGLVDAHELSDRLRAVVSGERTPDALTEYGHARMQELRRLFGDPKGMPAPPGTPDWAVRVWPRIVASTPATGAHLDELLEQLAS